MEETIRREEWNLGEFIRRLIFVLAPFIALLIILFGNLEPGKPAVTYTLAVAILMAVWWVTEIVPLAITSLLPIVLFPMLGIMNGREVSTTYFNHVIFLFIGGFLVALAIQKWNLHRRIAINILNLIGLSPGKILVGFILASSFLSMWISNTATAMLMVPILLSIIQKLEEVNGREKMRYFSIGLLLSIAYGCSIGGIATLVGTPPNLSFARILYIYFPEAPDISFATWFFYAFPISFVLFIVVSAYLYFVFVKKGKVLHALDKETILREKAALGPMSYEEKIISLLFILLALLWFFRSDIEIGFVHIKGWSNLFGQPSYFNDGTVAIFIAVILFLIPSRQQKAAFLMDWKAAEDIPWEIILLFGGGFALASGFKESGLSLWFGHQLEFLKGVHPVFIILAIAFLVTFLTEVTSNTATVETILPVLAGLAVTIQVNPLLFMLPATIAGSLAFMLPVATPPNAIIFGTQRLRIYEMAKAGLALNFIGIIIVTLATYYLGVWVFGIEPSVFPDWAN